MSRPAWFVSLLKATFPRNPAQFKLARIPFIERLVERKFFDGDDVICLPKDSVIPVNEAAETPPDFILPSQVAHHFIDQAKFHWIMNFCICRSALKCKDYPIEYGCIFLGESASQINPEFGRQVTKEEAHAYVGRVQAAGLVQTVGRAKLDAWWLGVGDKLFTICNCCPCCCMTRFLPYSGPSIQAKLKRMPGVSVTVTEACIGCDTCTQGTCFAQAISMSAGHAVIDQAACRGCGRCVAHCPAKAIKLTVDDPHYVDLAIDRLTGLVDLS